LNLFKKLGENGAPGMRPNFNKVVSFQRLSELPFWKNGPESGPKQKKAGFYEKSWLATGEIAVIGEIPQNYKYRNYLQSAT
jgi:hypothetical protein